MSLLACVVGEPALKHYSNMCRDPECVIVQLLPRPGGWRRRPERAEARMAKRVAVSVRLLQLRQFDFDGHTIITLRFFVNNCLFKMNWKEKLKSLQGVQARIVSSVVGGKVRTNIFLIMTIISIEYLGDILLIL